MQLAVIMIVAVQTYIGALQKKIRGRMHIRSWACYDDVYLGLFHLPVKGEGTCPPTKNLREERTTTLDKVPACLTLLPTSKL